jgi:hypothetical protein
MFGTNTVKGSFNLTQQTPKRTASSVFNNTLASGTQQADSRNFNKPFQGRGIQAGSPGQQYFQQSRALAGLMDARGGAQQSAMGIYEQNRGAEQQAQIGQAQEFARMGAAAQDMDQSDWSERYTADAANQSVQNAMRQYALQGQQATNRIAQGFLSPMLQGLLSDSRQQR